MPVPANKTFNEIREQFDKRLEKLSLVAGDSGQGQRIDKTLNDWCQLEALATSESQRTLYLQQTGSRWEDGFWRARELRFMSHFGFEGEKLLHHLWKELPNSRYKRFQELFSDPESYSVPRIATNAPVARFPTREILNTCSLRSCLVSPDRIPNKLAQDLGLVTWPATTTTPLTALTMKAQGSVTQGLKAIWEATQTLDGRNQRILVIGQSRQPVSEVYPAAQPIPANLTGSIIYVREHSSNEHSTKLASNSPWVAPRRIASFFPTVYAALRKTEHETSGYDSEMTGLSTLRVEWETLNGRINREWRRATPEDTKKELRTELATLVARSRVVLESASNHHKQQAETFFTALSEQLASGSNNISAMLTRTVAAIRRLERRLNEVPHKSGFNETDRVQLRRVIDETEQKFNLVHQSLIRASTVLRDEVQKPHGFFQAGNISGQHRTIESRRIISKMAFPIDAMKGVNVRPFCIFADKIAENYHALSFAIKEQDLAGTQSALAKIVALSKLQRANAAFEQLRRYTSSSTPVPLSDVVRIAATLRNALETRITAPQALTESYHSTYQAIQRVVRTLATKLEEYQGRGLDLNERALMYKRLRAYLDKTDVESEVYKLP